MKALLILGLLNVLTLGWLAWRLVSVNWTGDPKEKEEKKP